MPQTPPPERNSQELLQRLCVNVLPALAYASNYVTSGWTVGFAFDTQEGEHALGSDRRRGFVRRQNTVSVLPHGCDIYSASQRGGEYLIISIAEEDGVDLFGDLPGERVHQDLIDRRFAGLAQKLRSRLLRHQHGGELAEDLMLSDALALSILAISRAKGEETEAKERWWLTPARMKKIEAMIEDGLESGISVAGLAEALELSQGFFTRIFCAGTGMSPHKYILSRRVSRARRLLRDKSVPLAEIAAACGFSSQSHMTSVFTESLGISPAAVRRTQA